MTDGFLNDLGLDNVEADPNYIAPGKYSAQIIKSEIQSKKDDPTNKSWVITYKLGPDHGKFSGKNQQQRFQLNPKGEYAEMQKSFLKKFVLAMGVPESRISSLNPQDIVGNKCVITIKHKDGYQNVSESVLEASEGSVATGSPVVSAPPTGDVSDLL